MRDPESGARQEAADRRLEALMDALDAWDTDDDGAQRELFFARERLGGLVAIEVMKRRHLVRRLGGDYGPDRLERSTVTELLLWDLCIRYERIAGIIEVYVGDERLMTVAVAALRQSDPSLN